MRSPRDSLLTEARRSWQPPEEDRCIRWEEWENLTPYLRNLVERGCGAKIQVSKEEVPRLPPQFQPSSLSLQAGAKAVYREDRPLNHFHVREYGPYWEIELDKINPHYYPIDHLISAPFDMVRS